jgi:hypothetical protein
MDSGVPLAPSFTATFPMMFTHFMGTNPSAFHNGMHNYDAQSMPQVSNHFPIDMPNVPSPFPSSPSPTYMNPNIGSEGTMAPPSKSSFDMSHDPLNMPILTSGGTMAQLYAFSFEKSLFPQPTLAMGGWNLPSYGSSPSHVYSGANTNMGDYSTYYIPSMYPSFAMPVPTNTFPMVGPHVSLGFSYRGNQFYGSGYPLHGIPSHGGNLYPHLNNPYHTSISSETSTSVMMPVQTSMDQLGGG